MAKKQKYYVVWEGHTPGIYDNWQKCQKQIHSFPAAKYKAFDSLEEAKSALKGDYTDYYKQAARTMEKPARTSKSKIVADSISVDAACSGNPGVMEYQGVVTLTGEKIFYQGPFKGGTNNIGEFLALVHALALLTKLGKSGTVIYSDSKIAIGWVRDGRAKTKLEKTGENSILFELIARAEEWLAANPVRNSILKWETSSWGENPADFGRK